MKEKRKKWYTVGEGEFDFCVPISEVLDQKAIRDQEDRELVKKSIADPEMFARIIERYEKPIIRYISRISFFSSEECEEIAQKFLYGYGKIFEDMTRISVSQAGFTTLPEMRRLIHFIRKNHVEENIVQNGMMRNFQIFPETSIALEKWIRRSVRKCRRSSEDDSSKIPRYSCPPVFGRAGVSRNCRRASYSPGTVATLLHRAKAFSDAGKRANIFDIS